MNINQLNNDLKAPSSRNDALQLLTQIIVDTDTDLVNSLSNVILEPESIEDTNHFASVLKFLAEKDFIPPLITAISKGDSNSSPWLADYMYALDCLLSDQDDWLHPEEGFVHLLGKWLFTAGGGEISWKAGLILASIEHSTTKQYFMRGALDQSLLNLTRVACIRGIVNHYRNEASDLFQKLSNDPDEHIRKAVADANHFLERRAAARKT